MFGVLGRPGQGLLVGIFFLLLSTAHAGVMGQSSSEPELVIGLGWLQRAELDPSGRFLATCSDSALHIWYVNGSLVSTLPAREGVPWAGFGWSPSGSMIAVSNYLGKIIIVATPGLVDVAELEYDYHGMSMGGGPALDTWPLSWSPNGSLLAHGWWYEIHIYDVKSKRHLGALREGGPWSADVNDMDWSPDGMKILGAGSNGTCVYDLSSGRTLLRLDLLEEDMWGLDLAAFSPDGTTIATLHRDALRIGSSYYPEISLRLYDAANGALRASVVMEDEYSDSQAGLAWSPDGRFVAVGTTRGRILLFRGSDGDMVSNTSAHPSAILSLSWVGCRLSSASEDQTVKLWEVDASTGLVTPVRTFLGWGSAVRMIQWYPDGEHLLSVQGGSEAQVRVYVANGSEDFRIEPTDRRGESVSAAISPDGKMIVTATRFRGVSIWDAETGLFEGYLLDEAKRIVADGTTTAYAFLPVVVIISAISVMLFILWMRRGKRVFLALSASALLAAILVGLAGITVQRSTTQTSFEGVLTPKQCRWHPTDPNILGLAGWGLNGLWNTSDLQRDPVSELPGAYCLTWSPEGDLLALGRSSKVEVWDPWTQAQLVSVPTWEYVLSVAWSPDGSKLACLARVHPPGAYGRVNPPPLECRSMTDNAKLTVWEVVKRGGVVNLTVAGEALVPRSMSTPPGCIAWAPNSTMLAAATGHEGYVTDSTHMAWARGCGMVEPGVMIWQLDPTGGLVPRLNLTGPVRPMYAVDWSPDGSRIAAGADDGTIRVWRVGP